MLRRRSTDPTLSCGDQFGTLQEIPVHGAARTSAQTLIRKRQRDRARIMAWLLGAFVVLLFFITIAKTGMNW